MNRIGSRFHPRPARLVGLAAVVTLMSGCSGASSDGTLTVIAEKDRRPPVTLTGKTLEGRTIDLATLRGKPVVINVWGSWCPPCRKEAPDLQAASVKLAEQGIPVIGVNSQDFAGPAQAFERTFKITYPSIKDDGTALLAFRGAVSPKSLPATLVLDAQGRIAARSLAPVTQTTLLDLVQDATRA